jgi:hypothetical protein
LTLIIIHPQAFLEIEAAKKWYDNQFDGLGNRLITELDRALECIGESPESWPPYVFGTRRFLLHIFPFAIIYSYDGSSIKIFALMHLHRTPGYWVERFN